MQATDLVAGYEIMPKRPRCGDAGRKEIWMKIEPRKMNEEVCEQIQRGMKYFRCLKCGYTFRDGSKK